MFLKNLTHARFTSAYRAKHLLLTLCWLVPTLLSLILPPSLVQAQTSTAVLPPTFSVQRGFYNAPFQVILSTATTGATIRYTTDGTTPSKTVGTVYSGPLTIATTTPLRALVYTNNDKSIVVTQTYIFLNQVRAQSNTPLPGWPNLFAATDASGPYPADYEMDPDIVNHPNYTNKINGALQALPTLSLVTDLANLWDPNVGIYYNPNEKNGDPDSRPDPLNNKWERPIALEWINPDGTTGFSELAGARMHGQASRRPKNTPKRTFRIVFKKQYGVGKLDFSLFDFADPVGQFDGLILRMGGNRSWNYYDRDQRREADYVNDEWARRTWLQMGHLTARGTYVHLYLNGVYWGIYNAAERLDEKFLAAYLGGTEADYDYIVADEDIGNAPSAQAGTLDAFNELLNLFSGTAPISNATYQQIAQRMDLVDFADYLLHTHYLGKTDWPNHNWNAYRQRTGPDTRFRWMPWDNDSGLNKVNQAWDLPSAPLNYPQSPSWMFLRLITNAEFRQLFADRIYKHVISPDGALAPANCAAIYTDLTNKLDQAIIAESARWGDYVRDVYARPDAVPNKSRPAYLYSRDLAANDPANYIVQSTPPFTGTFEKKSWVQVRSEKLGTYCPNRGTNLVNQYVIGDIHVETNTLHLPLYQTTLVPPTYSQRGGAVAANYGLVIANPNNSNAGDIYYTTDGSDPRALGGAVAPAAINGGDMAQVVINQVLNVKARVKDGANWSPLIDYLFYPPQPWTDLVINEIHYHPTASAGVDADDYEFIELYNRGASTLQLANVAFTQGVSYHFPVGSVLAPQQYLVLVSNPVAFSTRYPGITPFGTFRGHLSNSGERLKLVDAVSTEIDSVTYTDQAPWPVAADGTGASLELVNPTWDNALAANWQASTVVHGTPGARNSTFLASLPPTVTLTSPVSGTVFPINQPVTLQADASASDGAIAQVAFFVNDIPIPDCVVTTAPYACRWTPATVGSYHLTAQATNTLAVAAASHRVTVSVTDPANQPPTVSLTSPQAGAIAVTGTTVQLAATAADADGNVVQVAFFVNDQPLPNCVALTAPYECAWTPLTAGVYQLTAQATDNQDGVTRSESVSVTVNDAPNQPPTVTLTSPANGATVHIGQAVVFAADAGDEDGDIAQVAFFVNDAPLPICVDMAAPYACTWTPSTVGTYMISAEATDNKGAATRSASLSITVNDAPNQPPSVTLTSPVNGQRLVVGQPITMTVSASDSDGRVTQVAFFVDDVALPNCVTLLAPYACSWTPTAVGTYRLTAQAIDNNEAVSTTPPTSVIVETAVTGQNPSTTLYLPLVQR